MSGKLTALLAAALLLAGCGERSNAKPHLARYGKLRIVSISPNVTEILYELGLDNQVAGVSRYSNWPPEATEKPCVGGTYDPNWEMIVSLQPDLVIGLDSQQEIAGQLKQLGIEFLGVPHERVTEIMDSILIIGEACGAQDQAQELFHGLETKVGQAFSLSILAKQDDNRQAGSLSYFNKPRVLVCIGHDEQLTRMYIAARNTFYDDLINMAGGTNACEQTAVKYPEISPEGLRSMQPDLIIDISPNLSENDSDAWKPYRAVVMTNSYAFIPGPRFGLLLEDFSTAIRQSHFEAE